MLLCLCLQAINELERELKQAKLNHEIIVVILYFVKERKQSLVLRCWGTPNKPLVCSKCNENTHYVCLFVVPCVKNFHMWIRSVHALYKILDRLKWISVVVHDWHFVKMMSSSKERAIELLLICLFDFDKIRPQLFTKILPNYGKNWFNSKSHELPIWHTKSWKAHYIT